MHLADSYTSAFFTPADDGLHRGIWPRSAGLWMAAFWIALLIIRPWEEMFPSLADWHVARVYAIAMIAAVVGSGKFRTLNSPQTAGVVLFLFALGLSWLGAGDSAAAWDELYKYATLVVFYFVLLSVIRSPYHLFFIIACYLAVMALYLGKAQYEYFFHGHRQYTMGVSRLIGIEKTFGGPNGVAASTVLSLPLLHLLWQVRHELTATWPDAWRKWFPRFLLFYLVLAVSSVILTNSRSGMLGCVLFALLVVLAGKRLGRKLAGFVVALLLCGVVWSLMPEESQNRLRTVWEPEAGPISARTSAEGRLEGFKAGLAMFRRQPLTGVGIGNFVRYRVAEVDGVPLQSHNLLGQILGETGITGTAAFAFFVAVILVNCRKTAVLARTHAHPTFAVLAKLTGACRSTILLLLFFGISGHNLLRFNWLWMAAFALLCREFGETCRAEQPEEEEAVWQDPDNRREDQLLCVS